ncbi:cardiomyopathy-associated protein 5 isoform X1 [Cyprinodon tularosa]|uniref:cardiomyopathy-associated protein 5 isoform X1 n=2 Tax=Cyprinodon tularosa TaxID=77115 RepID=UPI0018E28207|nr:cardiomyopathy-associated protein 5 isoform X1 [Cyprinodon tularosa]
MEECESVESELQEFQDEALSQDDDDEVEELHNSLREAIQDHSVKPKLQCLMVDPSFSMVTVQSEDSGIVWETASSRCSTPWASEASSTSEACSMEGSGGAGKITIVFDEDKVIRRRMRSGGRSSRLGDRLSRPGSSRSASTLGVERPEMAEVSLPNIKEEKRPTEADLEDIKSKDQQLFSLISEGYEILNIRVPSKLPTVDEEESTDLQDNLSYLDQTPKIRSRNHNDLTNHREQLEAEQTPDYPESSGDTSQPLENKQTSFIAAETESMGDIDYIEKFTLLDVAIPEGDAPQLQREAEKPPAKVQTEKHETLKEAREDGASVSEDSFVFVSEAEIVGEHLDEVFYGEGPPIEAPKQKEEGAERMRLRRESQRSMKDGGLVLFESEETTLTPIFLSPGPPKIIDPILLEEPTAMSFMYTDLYEDAVGEKRRSDEEHSEAESVASEKSYKRRLSDSEEEDGYLEKFRLKDETPAVDVQTESVENEAGGRMMWPQSKFEMNGCLIRAAQDEEEEEKIKNEEIKMQETLEEKQKVLRETEEKLSSEMTHDQGPGEVPKERHRESKSVDHTEIKLEQQAVEPRAEKTDKTPQIETLDETSEGRDEMVTEESFIEAELPSEKVAENMSKHLEVMPDKTTSAQPERREEPPASTEPTPVTESTERSFSEEEAPVIKAADEKHPPGAEAEAKEPGNATHVQTENLTASKASSTVSVHEDKEASSEDVASLKAAPRLDSAVQAVEKVMEGAVNEKEMQTQMNADVKEAIQLYPERKEHQKHLSDEYSEECKAEADQKSGVKTDNLGEITQPTKNKEIDLESIKRKQQTQEEETTDCKSDNLKQAAEPRSGTAVEDTGSCEKDAVNVYEKEPSGESKAAAADREAELKTETLRDITESTEHQNFNLESTNRKQQTQESDNLKQAEEPRSRTTEEDAGTCEQDVVNVGDELVVLVPKGQAVEMDIQIDQWSEDIIKDVDSSPQPGISSEVQVPEPWVEEEPVIAEKEEEPASNELDSEALIAAPGEKDNTKDQETHEDKPVLSLLRSYTPKEDLSELQEDDVPPEESEQKMDIKEMEEEPEINLDEDAVQRSDLHREEVKEMLAQSETVIEASEETVEDLGYEVIGSEEAKDMVESEIKREEDDSSHQRPKETDTETEKDELEEDYEIIDAEEQSQARLAAELLGMDWFCMTCGCLLSEQDCRSAEHHNHQVCSVEKAYEDIKETLGGWISELQARSENIEDLVSELELAYNSVEDQFTKSEAAMQAQNDEMMALVMEQYNTMSVSMEEEKKAKLEQLYDKIVSYQENIDSAKSILETSAREAETDARPPEDIHARLQTALDSALSLELGPKGLLVFEDYTKANSASSNLAQRKGIPVPQRPTLQPQEPGSASSTSVTVYWKVNPGDIIDCFQVYCMEDPQGAVSEEYRVTVKESYCVLEDLEPDRMYKVWVMAVNYTGCSLPSERLLFRTAPSGPTIDAERCSVMWDSATLRWSSTKAAPGLSYTLEYCRQYDLEGEGLRSISGIKGCEQKVVLQPNENYLFYIKAVNEAGANEQSEATLVSTKGTRFQLLKSSAHPTLTLSDDNTTLQYSQDAQNTSPSAKKECPSILGELLPSRGLHYWEAIVVESPAYRLGVMCSADNLNGSLGEDSSSWCLQCTHGPSGCRYLLLHNGVQTSIFVTETPERVGTLLDHQLGCLSFYNASSGQLLGSFTQLFSQPCYPALALELPGSLQVWMVPELPEFTKHSKR